MAMELKDWIAAIDANPGCRTTLSAFSDWLQERGNPEWEPVQLIAEAGGNVDRDWIDNSIGEMWSGDSLYGNDVRTLAAVWLGSPPIRQRRWAWVTRKMATGEAEEVQASRKWLQQFADGMPNYGWGEGEDVERPPVTYTQLMDRAGDYVEKGRHWNEGTRFESFYPDNMDEFWVHYATLTGECAEYTGSFFSCSC